jgi:hypothetical protein
MWIHISPATDLIQADVMRGRDMIGHREMIGHQEMTDQETTGGDGMNVMTAVTPLTESASTTMIARAMAAHGAAAGVHYESATENAFGIESHSTAKFTVAEQGVR